MASMKVSKKKQEAKMHLQVFKNKFFIKKASNQGEAHISYEKRDVASDTMAEVGVKLPIISIWRDPVSGNAAKAHLSVVARNLQQKHFMRDIAMLGKVMAPDGMEYGTSGDGILRYGTRDGKTFRCENSAANDYRETLIYDSKALAMEAIIQEVTRYKNVAGLQLITLDAVPDAVLIEFGFERIPDIMKRGVDMWMGAPRNMFAPGSYSDDWRATEKNVESFLSMLSKAPG